MKTRSLLAVGALALAAVGFGAEINWNKDYTTAVAAAKAGNKLIMIDFYTDWCGWCKKLDSETYVDADVVKQSEKYVALKTDAEKEGKDLATKYKVRGFPTILFIDGKGDVYGKIVGYQPAKDFQKSVAGVLDLHKRAPMAEAALKKDPNDVAAHGTLLELCTARGDVAGAKKHLVEATRLGAPANDLAVMNNRVGDAAQEEKNDPKAGIPYFAKAAELATEVEPKAYALVSLASTYAQLEEMTKDTAEKEGFAAEKTKYAKQLVALEGANPDYVNFAKSLLG